MVDIPSVISGNAPQTPAPLPAATDAALALAAKLGVLIGEKMPALITAVSELTTTERDYLLSKTASKPQTPLEGRHSEQKSVLAQLPSTRLVEILVKNSTAALLSQLPLEIGTTITVRIRPDGQMQLVPIEQASLPTTKNPSTAVVSESVKLPATTQSQPTNSTEIKPEKLDANVKLALSANTKLTESTTGAIYTPQRKMPTIAPNQTELGKIPNPDTTVSPQIAKTKLVQHYVNAQLQPTIPAIKIDTSRELTLPKPVQLQMQQLQNALKQILQTPANPTALLLQSLQSLPVRLPPALQAAPPALFKALQTLVNLKSTGLDINQLMTRAEPSVKNAIAQSGQFYERNIVTTPLVPESRQRLEQDAKYTLFTAYQTLLQALPSVTQIALPQDKPLLEQLLQLFTKPQTAGNKGVPATHEALIQQLEKISQAIRSSFTQIQLQQYRSALSALSEPAHQQSSLLMELPIRLFDGFGSIFVHWQEQKSGERGAKKNRKGNSQKANWRVYLEMELEGEGALAIDLQLSEKNISAQMWADSPTIQQRATEQMEQLKTRLQEKGLTVTDLRCHKSAIPNRAMKLDYTIIDVKT